MSQFIIKNELSEENQKQLLEMYQQEWWSSERTSDDFQMSLNNSSLIICVIDQKNNKLAAFSRILTDYFKFAYVYDVIVENQYRGVGLSNLLLNSILEHPKLIEIENMNWFAVKK